MEQLGQKRLRCLSTKDTGDKRNNLQVLSQQRFHPFFTALTRDYTRTVMWNINFIIITVFSQPSCLDSLLSVICASPIFWPSAVINRQRGTSDKSVEFSICESLKCLFVMHRKTVTTYIRHLFQIQWIPQYASLQRFNQ